MHTFWPIALPGAVEVATPGSPQGSKGAQVKNYHLAILLRMVPEASSKVLHTSTATHTH
jgi:hypothetical protein